jgi:hypothetical protein
MRSFCILVFTCALGFIACQKEMSSGPEKTTSTADSLLGRWQMVKVAVVKYDMSSLAIDTVTAYDEEVSSFIEFKADSSFSVNEQYDYGYSGTFYVNSNRDISILVKKETFDDFGPNTNVFNPPQPMTMRIQALTDHSAILTYRMASSTQQFTYRFHYFLTK